jgi:hypothetical protein
VKSRVIFLVFCDVKAELISGAVLLDQIRLLWDCGPINRVVFFGGVSDVFV